MKKNQFTIKFITFILILSFGFIIQCDSHEIETEPSNSDLNYKADFIEIEPVTYYLKRKIPLLGYRKYTSSRTRIWYAFQPADENPEEKPLFVFFNGGPGAATRLLFGYNTSKMSLDTKINGGTTVGPNPYSWTSIGNLLYIDARQTGFSYDLLNDPENKISQYTEYTQKNFNPFIDGADFVRVILRFLNENPIIKANKVVIVGESYGGTRSAVMLNLLLYYSKFAETNDTPFKDEMLSEKISAHLHSVFPDFEDETVPPEIISEQFGHQILIQPFIAGIIQEWIGAELLTEEPDSPLQEVAEETGIPLISCKDRGFLCNPVLSKTLFIKLAGVDSYCVNKPSGHMTELTKGFVNLVKIEHLEEMIGTDPREIEGLYAHNRLNGHRGIISTIESTLTVKDGNLSETFGDLKMWDAFYVRSSPLVYPLNVIPTSIFNTIFGKMFLENIPFVKTFITNAKYDSVCYTPAIPPSLEEYDTLVDRVEKEETKFTVYYNDDAFPDNDIDSVNIYFPYYSESGHSVPVFEPEKIYNDVNEWYLNN